MAIKQQTWGAGVLCTLTLSVGLSGSPALAQPAGGLVRLMVPTEDATSYDTHSMVVTSKPTATGEDAVTTERAAVSPLKTNPTAAIKATAARKAHTPHAQTAARIIPLDYDMAAPAITQADFKTTPSAFGNPGIQMIQSSSGMAATTPGPAPSPQDFTQLEQRLRALDVVEPTPFYGGATPGVVSHIPSAYGAYKGDAAIGVAYQNRNRGVNNDDGAIGAVIGFGSPRTVGVTLGLNIYDLGSLFDNRNTSFGHTASISLKLQRPIQRDTAVALGVDDLIRHHPEPLQHPSYFAVVSQRFRLKSGFSENFSRLYATLGVGNGRYRSVNDIAADKSTVGIFGGLALAINERATVFTEWTGQDLNLGVSFVPFRRLPLVITPALADLTHQAGNNTRFTLGATYRINY